MSQIGPDTPLAIVGLGARLPGGGNSPLQFWDLLKKGYDGISLVPPERWDRDYFSDPDNLGLVGKSIQNQGGFLKGWNPEEVDLKFFHLSPREAKLLDPNQRLLLELTYETIEDAGLSLNDMSGSRTGVIIGLSAVDYSYWQFPDINTIDSHTQTGLAHSIVANRLSYFYNLLGPSFSVDTACSSSLVALNCATQSIRSGECKQALVGAINLMLFPECTVGFSKLGVLSPDGHCKAFDATANGYVRSEGAGMLLIKPLADAERDHNRIFAVIKGTACCSDGKMNPQMTSPSEEQQEWIYNQVLKLSNIYPSEINYVEAHGTGTAVGDPIECRSISKVIGVGRDKTRPVLVGSNKSNVGHLEPAAGIVSLIKLAMSVKYNLIPPTISVKNVNPKINPEAMNIRFCTKLQPFPKGEYPNQPRTALASAFGFGGTNACAIVQEYQGDKALKDCPPGAADINRSELILISAKSDEALKEQAKKLAEYLASHTSAPLAHVAYTLACHRSHHTQHRFACISKDKAEAVVQLRDFVESKTNNNMFTGTLSEKKRHLVVVFCGQGPHWFGMGRSLFQSNAVYREAVIRCAQIFAEMDPELNIIEEMHKTAEESLINKCEICQPIYFALQTSLFLTMKAAGIVPEAIVGHSIGEPAAAFCSGVLSLEDGCRVIFARSRAQKALNGKGYMAAVKLNVEALKNKLRNHPDVSLAGHNSPNMCNIAGKTEAMNKFLAEMDGEVWCKRLPVDEPAHSTLLDTVRDLVEEPLRNINPLPPTIPIISTYLPQRSDYQKFDADYWFNSLRHEVRFNDAILEAARRTETPEENNEWIFLELDPGPALSVFINEVMSSKNKQARVVPTFTRNNFMEREALQRTFSTLYTLGFTPNFREALFKPVTVDHSFPDLPAPNRDVSEYYFVHDLPQYAWSRTRCWNENRVHAEHRLGTGHPIVRIKQDGYNPVFEADLSISQLPWVADHLLQGNIVIPGVTYVECFLTCAKRIFGDNAAFWIRDVHFKNAFYMNREDVYRVNISLSPIHKPGGRFEKPTQYNISISSHVLPVGEWDLHCTGVVELEEEIYKREQQELKTIPGISSLMEPIPFSEYFDDIDLDFYKKMCVHEQPAEKFYSDLWEDGLELLRELRLVRKVWVNDTNNPVVSLGYVEVNPEMTTEELSQWTYMYPPMIDSCLQSGLFGRDYRGAFFPVEAKRARFIRPFDPTKRHAWAVSRKDPITGLLSMTSFDEDGKVYGSLQDVRIHYLEKDEAHRKGAMGADETPVYEHKWDYVSSVHNSRVTEANLPAIPTITPYVNETVLAIQKEFRVLQDLKEVELYSDTLAALVILHQFRHNFKFFADQTPSTIKAVPLKTLADQADIIPFYHRLIVVFANDLQRMGYVKLSPLPPHTDTVVIENCQLAPTEKYFTKKDASGNPIVPESEDPEAYARFILSRQPQMRPSTVQMIDISMNMHKVMQSATAVDPVSLIFADGVTADAVYRDDLEVRPYNFVAQGCLGSLLKDRPKDLPLNILEVGAGTGGTTAYLLDLINPLTTTYTFTDIGRSFLPQGQQKFAKYKSCMEFKHLDIEKDPIEQGFIAESQDIIVAANVLHATCDLSVTFSNVLKLLKPGGVLILFEALNGFHWLDTVYGLTKGWWSVTDLSLRRHPLLSKEGWVAALKSFGYQDPHVFNNWEPNKTDGYCGRLGITLAQKPLKAIQEAPVTLHKERDGTCVVLAEEKNVVGGQLISSLLLEGFKVVGVTRNKALDLKTISGAFLSEVQITALGKNYFNIVVENPATSRVGYDAIWAEIEAKKLPPVVSIVHNWSLDIAPVTSSTPEVMNSFDLNVYSPLYLTHSLMDNRSKASISQDVIVWGSTSGVWAVDHTFTDQEITNGQQTLWGLNRCILNEVSNLHPHSIDITVNPSTLEKDSYCKVIVSAAVKNCLHENEEFEEVIESTETEIAVRGNQLYGQRLVQHDHADSLGLWMKKMPATTTNYALTTNGKKKLIFQERVRQETIGDDDVEVHVASSGLNYRDILQWQGRLPPAARQGSTVGLECAGLVARVGKNVTNFKEGDRVWGVGRECAASYAILNKNAVGKAPSHYAWDQIGGLGLSFATVYYALVLVANIKKGDRVLIHSATGGVGLLAISLCKHVGAIPYCTAGADFKRTFLKISGIEHIYDSHSNDFAEQILRDTNGAGVNIVLNSLASPASIEAGFKCLSPGGHFLELGKQDLYAGSHVNINPLASNCSFNVIALDKMMLENHPLLGSIFSECSRLLEEKAVIPPPAISFQLNQVDSAYNFFSQSKHIGKVILFPVAVAFAEHAIPETRAVLPLVSHGSYIREDGTYLITAGTSGFTLELAKGLLDRGAKHLVLCSRSGAGDKARQAMFEDLRKYYNAEIYVTACDSSNEKQTRELLAHVRKNMPPLRGIIHGAMVLNDGFLQKQTHQSFWDVLAPKSFGAWVLHDDTVKHKDPLDMFLVLSSLNVVVGTHGQANYASANMYLNGLILHRRSLGLPGLAIEWGVIGETGFVHRSQSVKEGMATFGFRAVSPAWAKRIVAMCLEAESDKERERVGELPPKKSLSATFVDNEVETFKSIPRGLYPYSIRPENDARLGGHYFEGSNNQLNIYRAHDKINHAPAVPCEAGVFNVDFVDLLKFFEPLNEIARFAPIRKLVSEALASAPTVSAGGPSGGAAAIDMSNATGDLASQPLDVSLRTLGDEEKALGLIADALAIQAAKVLGLGTEAGAIQIDVPLSQYGLDSLTAVEMKNWTERTVKVDVPVVDFVRGPSCQQMSRVMLTKFYDKFGKPTGMVEAAVEAETKKESSTEQSAQKEEKVEEVKEVKKRLAPKTAYVFTGQSSLKQGVGMDLYETFPEAKKIWDECDAYFIDQIGVSILKIVRENPKEYVIDFTNGEQGKKLRQKYMNLMISKDEEVMKQLNDPTVSARAFPTVTEDTPNYVFKSPNGLLLMTHFAQPIIIIYEYVALSCLKFDNPENDLISNAMFCGHSLGEYCALVSLGKILPASQMAFMCFIRGLVMQTCVPRDPITSVTDYGMAAVSPSRVTPTFKIEQLREVMKYVANSCGGRLLEIVNYNVYNDQYVVSGERFCIWQLGMVLDFVNKNPTATLLEIKRFCYANVGTHPRLTTPLEIPRTGAVLQLAGIDVPFHSSLLRKVVPLFRSFLDANLPTPTAFDYVNRLDGRYVCNLYSKEIFSISREYATTIADLSKSPFLLRALNTPSGPDSWDELTPAERARLLLRECLSYQFASAVQWIDAQNTIIKSGVRRVVEIGPAKTLANMMNKSVLRLKDQGKELAEMAEIIAGYESTGTGRAGTIEVLSFDTDRELLFRIPDEEQNSTDDDEDEED